MRKTEIPSDKLELYDRIIRERPHFERKGVALPYTSVHGHMFTFLSAEGTLGVRLPSPQREEFLKKYGTSLFIAHGAVLKEYVVVPEDLFRAAGELLKYLDLSYEYVGSLKPKQPRKSRKAGAPGTAGKPASGRRRSPA